MRRWSTFLAATFCCVPALGQNEQYLCVSDQATGFTFENNRWHPANFNVEESKFLVRPRKDDDLVADSVAWVVVPLGANTPASACESPFNERGFLTCEGFYTWRMNRRTLRFVAHYMFGYIDGDDQGNTPSVHIGKCVVL